MVVVVQIPAFTEFRLALHLNFYSILFLKYWIMSEKGIGLVFPTERHFNGSKEFSKGTRKIAHMYTKNINVLINSRDQKSPSTGK